jgi:cytochrome c-type biogenesis protein CcmH/NrfG
MNTNLNYCGWSSYETYITAVWLSKEDDGNTLLNEAIELEASDDVKASWLKCQLKVSMREIQSGANLWTDLLDTAFSRINWIEIIENNVD